MPIRGSLTAHHPRPQGGRDRPEWVVPINRNGWSQSIVTAGRDHPVRAPALAGELGITACAAVGRTFPGCRLAS